ncbi:MAG: hypothetical protein JRI68_16950 [Deltaproteobacteria bacterium]|nr:hypothetical protein [Deltaproteobacteria bacterium]
MIRATWLLVALPLLSCGGYRPPTLGACGDGVPLDDDPCGPGSTMAADRCFASEQAACDCLACPKDHCVIDDSDPGEATCVTEKPDEAKDEPKKDRADGAAEQ